MLNKRRTFYSHFCTTLGTIYMFVCVCVCENVCVFPMFAYAKESKRKAVINHAIKSANVHYAIPYKLGLKVDILS